ncbi:bifunctional DNA primase/polymerase [Streptomyces tsukubensis]|uniref:DNA primase n=1 Tax=Streptomyces tsukubensis TaxID=83656 RepID=A0A1V4A9L5_9ACTN|nr:bifunctional DNA primase/polymerase [Streptomyces tsukubensis]OON79196.1 DNA primase [Streptomyces tsukubensis]QFR94691.1 DNA primase [Streptomyces tsukubensis]
MATIDRQARAKALAHALSAAERGLAVIPLSRSKLPAVPSPHREEWARHLSTAPLDSRGTPPRTEPPTTSPADSAERRALRHARGDERPGAPPVLCRGACGLPGHGVYDASRDPGTIRRLFASAPWATGYGIACGVSPHYLIGLDLDTKPGTPDTGAALRTLALRGGFTVPETVVVLTPSGGRHLWLRGTRDTRVPNSVGRLAPGIDVRGRGGYLVGPGSLTSHGLYRFAPSTAHLPPAPCPTGLLRLLLPPPQPPPAAPPPAGPHRGEALTRFVRAARPGERNSRLFWAACRACESNLMDVLAPALAEAAIHTGLSPEETTHTLRSAARLTLGS